MEIRLLDSLESFEIRVSHRFDDKSLVRAEEKERTWFTLALSGFENAVFVVQWIQTFEKDLIAVSIFLPKESEYVWCPFCDLNVLIDD